MINETSRKNPPGKAERERRRALRAALDRSEPAPVLSTVPDAVLFGNARRLLPYLDRYLQGARVSLWDLEVARCQRRASKIN